MIEVKQIDKRFGRQKVLNKINLDIENDGIVAILGPNGSGKTTMIKSLLGLVIPDSGEILINGNKILERNDYRQNISYLPQLARFPDYLSIKEFFSFMESLKGPAQRKEKLIELFSIGNEMNKSLRKLSGGTLQKVNIVNCFMYDQPLIILDEPTVGLDPISMIKLKNFIKEEKDRGKLILITTHMMDFAELLADKIVFLLEGNIYFNGNLNQLFASTQTKSMEQAVARLLEPKTEIHV